MADRKLLTDEQIDTAARQLYERLNRSRTFAGDGYSDWKSIPYPDNPETRENYREAIVLAIPYLQLPWEPPTPTEINELTDENMSNPPAGYRRAVAVALQEFVSRRNATLIPKPVDPRQAAIVKVVTSKYLYAAPEVLANAILEELDNWTVINHGR